MAQIKKATKAKKLSREDRVKLAMATAGQTRQEAEQWVDIVDGKSPGDCVVLPGKNAAKSAVA